MYIIFGEDKAESLKDKFIVLEADTFNVTNFGEIKTYCVISAENVALGEMPQIPHWTKFHEKLVNGYKTQQWDFCLDCVTNLRGRFGGEMNSFYDSLEERINIFKEQGTGPEWSHVIQR